MGSNLKSYNQKENDSLHKVKKIKMMLRKKII